MRHLKVVGLFAFVCISSSLALNSLLTQSAHAAAQFSGQTYFEGVSIPRYAPVENWWIDNDLDHPSGGGMYALNGSVVPNTYPSRSTDAGYGAIGTKALNISMSASNQEKKQALYNFLWDRNINGTKWQKMGTAVIVHQMVGNQWGTGERNIAANDPVWAELKTRLVDNPAVIMDRYYFATAFNTEGVVVNGRYDAVKMVYDSAKSLDGWIFSVGGKNVYALEIICANPMGDLPGLPDHTPEPVVQYSLIPNVDANKPDGAAIRKGESVSIANSVRNDGPNNSNQTTWQVTRLTYSPGVNPSKNGGDNANNACGAFSSSGRTDCTVDRNLSGQIFTTGQTKTGVPLGYTVPNTMAPGTKVCFVVSVSPPTQNATPLWRHSAMRCIVVANPTYQLVPEVKLSPDGIVDPGVSTTVTGTVKNIGIDPSDPTLWRITQWIYEPGNKPDDEKPDNKGEPCAAFAGDKWKSCAAVVEQTDRTIKLGTPDSQNHTYPVPNDMPIGTKVCFVTSVRRPTYNDTNSVWAHSNMACITVGKKPKMQVWGGDIRSGGNINTSMSTIEGRTYGSWGEYAALSIEDNSGFASGAGLNGDSAGPTQSSWSKLTFANTGGGASCNFGCYDFSLTGPMLANQFAGGTTPTSTNLGILETGVYKVGNVSLSGATIGHGKSIVIISSGTVTIEGNITYENKEYTDIRDIPQVVIKAPTINIKNSAGQVDAWLLAVKDDGKGVLNTCSDSYKSGYDIKNGSLTIDRCDKMLTINGPVVADIVYLRRTAGSETQESLRGDPGEVFNLRADAYMWASAYGRSSNQVQTVYSKELSPRF